MALEKLSEILDVNLLNSAKCKRCQFRYKERGQEGCRWCIGRWKRLAAYKANPQKIVSAITAKVEPEYMSAHLCDFSLPALDEWTGNENLFFTGDTGTGKTRAMYALLKIATANGFDCCLLDFGQLCRAVRSAFDMRVNEQEIRDTYLNLDVLFIDDMGIKSNITDFEYDIFYDILDSRVSNGLATVISSNKTIEQLASSFDKRIGSRLHLFAVIEFAGKDRRTA